MSQVTKSLPSALRTIGVAVALAFGLATSAGAVTINGGLTSGALNTIEDQDREAYIDANGDGLISVGDVFIGVVRIDNFLPAGLQANNQVYGIISNQIIGFTPLGLIQAVALGPTTVAGLTLADLTGDANNTGAMVAVYDAAAPFSQDLINNPTGPSMLDMIDLITGEGTLRLATGIVDPTAGNDYLTAYVGAGFGVGSPNGIFTVTPTSANFGNYGGGLSVMYNNTAFSFLDNVVTVDLATGLHTTQLGIANGAFRGAVGDGNEAIFGSVPGQTQCSVADGLAPCGFVTDADFFVSPVPEPGSLALLGAALLGFAGLRRKAKKV